MVGVSLPRKPSRGNSARGCEPAGEDDDLPDHLTRCTCETHTGWCDECRFKITVGADGREYGHARAHNRGPGPDGNRYDCPHRPAAVDPTGGRSDQGGGKA